MFKEITENICSARNHSVSDFCKDTDASAEKNKAPLYTSFKEQFDEFAHEGIMNSTCLIKIFI